MKKFLKITFALCMLLTLTFFFGFNVEAANLTDQEMVQTDLELVKVPERAIISFPVAVNSPFNNKFNWTSDNPDVLEFMDGWFVVKRPTDEDVIVTVTVEVYRPSDETVKSSKDFSVLIPKGVTIAPIFNILYENVSEEEVSGFKTSYKLGEATFELETPVATDGKVFLGWYLDENFSERIEKVYVGSNTDYTFYAKWEVSSTYKVKYFGEPLEGSDYILLDEKTISANVGTSVQADLQEFDGFTFNPDHPQNLLSGTVSANGSLELKLYYTRNVYQVTFDTMGGTEIDPITAKYKEVITAPTAPTKVGYEFHGWDVEFPLEVTKDITVTASWKPALVDYTIKYYVEALEGGYEEMDSVTAKALTGTVLTLTNEKAFTGFTYMEGFEDEVNGLEIASDGSSVFKFYYSRNSYTVTFDLDGGSWSLETEVTVKYGAVVNAPSENPVKENFNFQGWNKTFPFSMPAENVTIVVQWTELLTFTVTFDSTGGSSVTAQNVIEGQKAIKPADPTKQGYTFVAWHTEDGEVFDFDTPITENITLYAEWAPATVQYTVKHYLQNVDDDDFTFEKAETKSALTGSSVTVNSLSFEGFTPTQTDQEATVLADGSLVVEFYYTRNSYTIKVLGNGANEADVTITAKFEASITPPVFTREGYTFKGWDKEFPATMPIVEEEFEITAQWQVIEFTITYYIANEFELDVANPNPTVYTIETAITLQALTVLDEHGIFIGWFADEDMTQPITEIELGSIGNITVYGLVRYSDEWTLALEIAYLDTLYDGFDFLNAEQLITVGNYGATIFWGFNNTAYSVGEDGKVTLTDPAVDVEITLTAIISINDHSNIVKFQFAFPKDLFLDVDFMDGEDLLSTQKVRNPGKATQPENPTKEGYEFLYWSTEPDGEEFDFDTEVTSDLVLYAVWEETDRPLTVEEFLELPDGSEATVKGYVYLFNDGSYIVSENGAAVLAYKYKGSAHGDLVIISGEKDYYNGCPQFASTATLVETISTGNVIPLTPIPMTIEQIVTSDYPDANLFGMYLEVTGTVVPDGNYYAIRDGNNTLSLYESNLEVLAELLNKKVTMKVIFYGNQKADGTGAWRAVFAGYEGEYVLAELNPAEKIEEAIAAVQITDGQIVTGNLVLPTEGLHGVVITWESDNPAINPLTGEVTRPGEGEDDVEVTLTATFSVGGVEETVKYTVTVKAEEETGGGSGFAEDLFISEYIEGSSNNKAIEIFNGTGREIDLSVYSLKLYANGAITASQTLKLSGTLAHGDVYVIYHGSAANAIKDVGDLSNSSVINFNGDDAIALYNVDTLIDIFGEIGNTVKWGENVTLVRKPEITKGNTIYNAEEWISYPEDTFNYLGSHTFNGTVEEKTPQEKLAAAKAEIELTDGMEVTTNLVLPTIGAYDVTITWESNNAAINAETGEVTRPSAGEDDVEVTLTAIFSVDGVQEVVTYTVIVKAEQESSGESSTLDVNFVGTTGNPVTGWVYNVGSAYSDGSLKLDATGKYVLSPEVTIVGPIDFVVHLKGNGSPAKGTVSVLGLDSEGNVVETVNYEFSASNVEFDFTGKLTNTSIKKIKIIYTNKESGNLGLYTFKLGN